MTEKDRENIRHNYISLYKYKQLKRAFMELRAAYEEQSSNVQELIKMNEELYTKLREKNK